MSELEVSLTLSSIGEGRWRGFASPKYEASTGMFGGWTAALLLKSVVADPRAEGSASAITVNYINRVPAGCPLQLRTRRLGGSRSIAHWHSELFVDGIEDVAASATVILTRRRESDRFTESVMPEAPAPNTLPTLHPPENFGKTMELRCAIGAACFNQPTTRSLAWMRETTGRPLDEVQLVYMSDVGWPRVFALSTGPRPSSTLTMSVYLHGTSEQLSACGDDYILSDMIGTRIEHSTTGSKASLWSRSGALLATTEQLCWFK